MPLSAEGKIEHLNPSGLLLHSGLTKTPRCTDGDFMLLYCHVCCRSCCRWMETFVLELTSKYPFIFLSFWQVSWPWPIYYLVRFWPTLAITLTLNFQGQIWSLLYLSQNGPIATKQIANILIELEASNVTIGFNLGHDIDLHFEGCRWNLLYLSQKMVRLP